ncbi:glucose-methanol-choline oxidoreductase [Umbelopsis sp. PMI_123]|nr:glucose-methanol-choline oxidoreductase [Umbelopsis sp. PMI_123]
MVFIVKTSINGYLTKPISALDGKVIPYSRGKGFGGCSMINCMVYTRGAVDDYAEWAKIVGTVQQRFQKNGTSYAELGPEYYRAEGTLNISVGFEENSTALMDAAEEVGWKMNFNLNSGNPIGVGMSAATQHDGMRITSALAHIRPDTPNLTIMSLSQVTKILFEGIKAIGVQVNGDTSLYASKEVILCAGAVDTPKLLLLSGIGPAKELESLDINVINDIPGIGKTLQDHCGVFITDIVDAAMSSRAPFIHDDALMDEARKQWGKDRTGPLSVHFNSLCAAFLKQEHLTLSDATKSYLQRPTIPALEIVFDGPPFPLDHVFEKGTTCFSRVVILEHPESRGSVTLASKNPSDPPLVDINYLDHPFDRLTIRKSSLSKYHIKPLLVPTDDSDEAIWKFIKLNILPILARWRHLADMSVAPVLISGHTQAVAYLIGQTAAEKIIQEYDLNA